MVSENVHGTKQTVGSPRSGGTTKEGVTPMKQTERNEVPGHPGVYYVGGKPKIEHTDLTQQDRSQDDVGY